MRTASTHPMAVNTDDSNSERISIFAIYDFGAPYTVALQGKVKTNGSNAVRLAYFKLPWA